MLRNIHPIFTGPALCRLRELGHENTIAIIGGNYPKLDFDNSPICLPGISSTKLLSVLLDLIPMDNDKKQSCDVMKNLSGDGYPEVVEKFIEIKNTKGLDDLGITQHDKEKFKVIITHADLVLVTTDPRPYAYIVLKKGALRRFE